MWRKEAISHSQELMDVSIIHLTKGKKILTITEIHYENTPMQYTENILVVKMKIFPGKNLIFFFIFAQNIDCGYTLEPPRRGGSNEYTQSMFWSKNKKNRYTPANPSFAI